MLDRRNFIFGGCASSAVLLAGCSSQLGSEKDLPEPLQVNMDPSEISPGVVALASFSAKVLVIRRKDYSASSRDALGVMSPTDLAVAWGIAAKDDVLSRVKITQSNRRYIWRYRNSDKDIPGVKDFTRYSGNWHMIPANEQVASYLKRVESGDIVRIEGDLVNVSFDNGIYYKTSLSRDDTGDGACEIIRARSIVIA